MMRYVFDTKGRTHYRFPTHLNDLVIDRKECAQSEVIMVTVEPGKAVHLHKHCDMEQIFYVVEGEGILTIGARKRHFAIKPSHVVRVPPGTLHTIRSKGRKAVKYVCVDCFLQPKKERELTWEKHVKAVCREQGYKFKEVKVSVGGK